MGACCSREKKFEGVVGGEVDDVEDAGDVRVEDGGSRVRLGGNSMYTSMFTQGGRKGINQDAMTVWEDFSGEKGMFFCAVLDGHGPSGHHVAGLIRDILPSRLSSAFKLSLPNSSKCDSDIVHGNHKDDSKDSHENKNFEYPLFPLWKASLIKSFEEMDEELGSNSTFDSFCSGTTAVTVIKQEDHLIIANLGDSRAVLCTRGNRNQLVPVQLTVDLKPNLPNEAERIKNCKGRVFALPDESGVYRLWMPDQNSPGLAMTRAFGDFCLKDYGLISIPDVSYRKLTDKDEFVVLASDGVWDVLSNSEVIRIVASAKKRSMAAQLLVDRAVREWKIKYPGCKTDDCAVICLFLKTPPLSTKSTSKNGQDGVNNHQQLAVSQRSATTRSQQGCESTKGNSKEEYSALQGLTRENSLLSLPRFSTVLGRRRSTNQVR
ncbi:probable protein phosphatase 2C 65 isoform X2 [Vitis riparia]|uniref:probable protein phosphatase 2C 65 isoform X2 n=1 Tax=Vitis riparia TaxID=96939 RepID=UPI00155A148A|nr:probable protein phosphatase 2C 65 isoform X2 [Vitis riparia]